MNEQAAILVDKLRRVATSDKEEEEDVFPHVTYCALDIICQAALGTNYNAQVGGEGGDALFYRNFGQSLGQV